MTKMDRLPSSWMNTLSVCLHSSLPIMSWPLSLTNIPLVLIWISWPWLKTSRPSPTTSIKCMSRSVTSRRVASVMTISVCFCKRNVFINARVWKRCFEIWYRNFCFQTYSRWYFDLFFSILKKYSIFATVLGTQPLDLLSMTVHHVWNITITTSTTTTTQARNIFEKKIHAVDVSLIHVFLAIIYEKLERYINWGL